MPEEYSSVENAYTAISNADRRIDGLIDREESILDERLEEIGDEEDPVNYRVEAMKSFKQGYNQFDDALEEDLERSERKVKLENALESFQAGEEAYSHYVGDLMNSLIYGDESAENRQEEASTLWEIHETVDTAVRDIAELKDTIIMPGKYDIEE